MAILLAYFIWVASTLAVIATAWIGVADSGVERVHLQRATAIQQSYDASFMAEDDSARTPRTASAAAAEKPHAGARRTAMRPSSRHRYDPRVALRLNPPPDGGH